jgi:CRISPR type I-E-associated protein CasB/Cse2
MVNQSFLQRIAELDKSHRIALRRAAGTMLINAEGKAFTAFYKAYPPREKEDQCFFAACLQCLWQPDDLKGAIPLEKALAKMNEKDENAFLKRLTTLLDLKWDEDGYLAIKLYRLVRFCKAKGLIIDCEKLLHDLFHWNDTSRLVQKKWARAVCGTQKLHNQIEGEDHYAN